MSTELIIPSFIAGLLTFLMPCTLPLVPAYLGIISGSAISDLQNPEKAKKAKMKIFLNGIFFVLGFSLVFILLGMVFGFVGSHLATYRIWLSRIGGVFVILFGLFMMGVVKLPFLENTTRLPVLKIFKAGNPINSSIIGASFGLGWSPCIGPLLASILFLASRSGTAVEGGVLLLVFSLGLAVPFLLIALGVSHASQYIKKMSKTLRWISIIGGLFLIALGVLLVTNSLGDWVQFFFKAFDFINYEPLYQNL